jgi:hypothetical protein
VEGEEVNMSSSALCTALQQTGRVAVVPRPHSKGRATSVKSGRQTQSDSSGNVSHLYSGGDRVRISTGTPTIFSEFFLGFPQSLQEHVRILS